MKKTALQPPEWFATGAIYQINPRTFSAEGTVAAVTKAVPMLKELGFRTVYLCPIFKEDDSPDITRFSERQKKSQTNNPKNPYRITDYFEIDDEYGTAEDLKQLARTVHENGMYLLLDLVYMHIGPNAPILQAHPEFAQHDAQGNVIDTVYHFPKINFDSPALREYLWCNMTYYIGQYDVDGFRCDVGDAVPLDFWAEGKRRMQAIKPGSVLLNEGMNPTYLEEVFDSCYAYTWHEALYGVLCGRQTVADLKQLYRKTAETMPQGALVMRDMDNHDTVTDWDFRVEEYTRHFGMDMILTMNYLLDGIPMVYCGNELADTTRLSMFANRFYPGVFRATDREALVHTDAAKARMQLIQTLNRIRRECPLFTYGQTELPECEDSVFAFRRSYGDKSAVFYGNFGQETCTVSNREGKLLLSGNCVQVRPGEWQLAKFGFVVLEIG